jgi:aminoglycoside/choline kinase family phosphotransferase
MQDAIDALVRWQLATRRGVLPPYDEALLQREMALFPDWYVARHLEKTLSAEQLAGLHKIFALLAASALAQPKVYVHRDYMPRNLMVSEPNPGVLDFQDAVHGPITYDVVCLLRDAFISWEEERVLDWSIRYWEKAKKARLPVDPDFGEFWRALEWMGLQRHLKVMGIFARLTYRDGKPKYVADTPRFLAYARPVARRYAPLAPLARLLDELA